MKRNVPCYRQDYTDLSSEADEKEGASDTEELNEIVADRTHIIL